MAGEITLNLFVSSPGDVQRERERIDFVVERLNAEFAGRARIHTIRWETRYYSSHDTFQTQIPEAAECDLVVAIFGARLGSPLPETFPHMPTGEPYPSGTAYELLSAIEARKGRGTPDVYVFRRPSAPLVSLDATDRPDVEAQWAQLTRFFETWFRNRGGQFIAAFQEFATTDEFADKIEDCLRQWLARRGFPAKSATWDRRELGSPFPGLAAFDETRRTVFFGRSLVIDQAIHRLREVEASLDRTDKAPFLLLIGASGSGKSSLLRAGLMPRVGQPGELPEVDLWRSAVTSLGVDPFLSLAESLLTDGALGRELSAGIFRTREILAKQLAGDPDAAIAPLRAALDAAALERQRAANFEAPRRARLFLAIDQAERLLIETAPDLQARFAELVAAMCRARVATVLIVLRSDAYARFQALPPLVALRDAGATLDLLPATASELEEMATRPAELCEPPLVFEQRDGGSLASLLVADARGGDALPLLQMTLARLAEAEAGRGDGVLRFADYQGLGESVSQTANEALAGIGDKARAELPQLIAGLVRDVTTDPITGKPTPQIGAMDRARFENQRPERKALVDAFVANRLLTSEGDAATQRVRPTHEALLRIWPEAVAIIADVAHHIRTREALQPIVREWDEAAPSDKARHLEISPALLDGATDYVRRFGEEATPATREFVAAAAALAEAKREKERLEQERRLADAQAIAAANKLIARRTGAGLVVAVALAGLAGWQWWNADIARKEAQAQRDRAERTLAAATTASDGLVFDLAQKFRNVSGVPKEVIKDILDKARTLQEQLLSSGETSVKLTANHAAALGEMADTEMTLGDTQQALDLATQARGIYLDILKSAPNDLRYLHDVVFSDEIIGDVLKLRGDLAGAEASYNSGLARIDEAAKGGLTSDKLSGDQSLMLQDLGGIERQRGNYAKAVEDFRKALPIARALAEASPQDQALQHGLAIAHRNLGDALLDQKDTEGAIAEFDAAAVIAKKLADESPNNTLLVRDFTLSQERLGETLAARQDYAGALKAFSEGEATAIDMAKLDPNNLEWQYDIAIGHIEVGDTQMSLGDFPGAAASYKASVEIDKALTTRDPSNALWNAHCWNSFDRYADALRKQGDAAGASAAAQNALDFASALLARTPADPDWLRRKYLALDKIGDLALDRADTSGALAAYREAHALAVKLPAGHDGDLDRLANLMRYAGLLTMTGDAAEGLGAYAEAEAILRASTVVSDPKAVAPRGQLATVLVSESRLLRSAGQPDAAIAKLREAIAIDAALGREQPGEPRWGRDESLAWDRLGDALAGAADAAGAIDAYRQSLALVGKPPADARGAADTRAANVLTEEALGNLLEAGKDYAGALEAMRAARALHQSLADDAPDDSVKRRAELIDDNAIGRLESNLGHGPAAQAALRDGLEIARKLAARPDADAIARSDLAISLSLVGSTLAQTTPADAEALFAEGLKVAQALVAADPKVKLYRTEAYLLGVNLGDVIAVQKKFQPALAAYVAARDVAAGTLAMDPADQNAAGQLKTSVFKIALLANQRLLAKDFDGALATMDDARPASQDQNWFDLIRAAALMFLGHRDEALAIYNRHRGEGTYGGKTWEQATEDGFKVLRASGLSDPLMAEVEATYAITQ